MSIDGLKEATDDLTAAMVARGWWPTTMPHPSGFDIDDDGPYERVRFVAAPDDDELAW